MIRIPIKYIFKLKIDVEIVLAATCNLKKWALSLSLLEINVATPPARNLDDVRFTAGIGPFKIGLIFAHYRGKQQTYEL